MNYTLRAGEKGSFTLGGPLFGPIRILVGLLFGASGVGLLWYLIMDEVEYMDPLNKYYDLAIFASVVFALLPPIFIWHGVRKECIRVIISPDEHEVKIFWRGIFKEWVEILSANEVEGFDAESDGGKFQKWHLVLRRKGRAEEKVRVAKFYEQLDAEREREEADRSLQAAKS